MLSSLQDTAKYARRQKQVALPLANAVVHHAKGDYSSAYECMQSVFDRTKEIGGSNAQLDMFEQTYIDVSLKSGHIARAKDLLQFRVKSRPRTPAVLRQLGEAYAQERDKTASEKYFDLARHWADHYKSLLPGHSPA